MKIDGVYNKAKPPGFIDLGRALQLIADVNDGAEQAEKTVAFRKAYKALLRQLRKRKIKIKIRSVKDKTNDYYSYGALGNAVWENGRKSIFQTGRIRYKNKIGQNLSGLLFFSKRDVVEFKAAMLDEMAAKRAVTLEELAAKDAEVIWSYVRRIETAIKAAGVRRETLKGGVHSYVTIAEIKSFITPLIRAHGWKIKDQNFVQFFPSRRFQELGIGREGSRPRQEGANSKAKEIVDSIQREILGTILKRQ